MGVDPASGRAYQGFWRTIFARCGRLSPNPQACSREARNLPSLRHGLSAGAALTPDLLAQCAPYRQRHFRSLWDERDFNLYFQRPTTPLRPGSPGRPQPAGASRASARGREAPLAAGETGLMAVHRDEPG